MSRISEFFATAAIAASVVAASASPSFAQAENTNELTAEGLALGAQVTDERKPGDTYFNGEFSDWSLRCIVVAEGDDPCQMYQLLSDEGGSPIIEFTMFRLPEDAEAAAGATVVVPLETALASGLTIKVDEEPAKSYPFAFCNPVGCFARIGLTAEEIEVYKRGATATLSIIPAAAPDRRVTAPLSLSGFTAAFEASSVLQQ